MRIAAPAKVNLSLHVTGKRPDGYHLLDSLVVFTDFGDALHLEPAAGLSMELAGTFAAELAGGEEDNLVIRAARLLQQETGVTQGAHIRLHKYIPVGAGLGGGSADAAAALRGLRLLWQADCNDAALFRLALQLGSDVPVCLSSRPAWMCGTGEKLSPFAFPAGDAWLVLANPRSPLLTRDVFRRFSAPFSQPAALPDRVGTLDNLAALLESLGNDLEKPAISLMPVIGDILSALRTTKGCRIARMSGSGATCFGLYASERDARHAAGELQAAEPAWWTEVSALARDREGDGSGQTQ